MPKAFGQRGKLIILKFEIKNTDAHGSGFEASKAIQYLLQVHHFVLVCACFAAVATVIAEHKDVIFPCCNSTHGKASLPTAFGNSHSVEVTYLSYFLLSKVGLKFPNHHSLRSAC